MTKELPTSTMLEELQLSGNTIVLKIIESIGAFTRCSIATILPMDFHRKGVNQSYSRIDWLELNEVKSIGIFIDPCLWLKDWDDDEHKARTTFLLNVIFQLFISNERLQGRLLAKQPSFDKATVARLQEIGIELHFAKGKTTTFDRPISLIQGTPAANAIESIDADDMSLVFPIQDKEKDDKSTAKYTYRCAKGCFKLFGNQKLETLRTKTTCTLTLGECVTCETAIELRDQEGQTKAPEVPLDPSIDQQMATDMAIDKAKREEMMATST